MRSIKEWLESIGLEEYSRRFAESRISLDVLPELTEADLEKLGIPLGDRKRLVRAIAALNRAETGTDLGPEPAEGAANLTASGQLRQITVCFVDLVGSTELAAELDLEDYKDLIRSYHLTCARLVSTHGGYVAQYAGDGVMAYFGYPRAEEDDPERAVHAALDIVREVRMIGAGQSRRLAARAGLATGQVLIGELAYGGPDGMRSAMGKIPNLASRLQTLAEPGGVVVSEGTRHLLGTQYICEDGGRHALKGFREPVQVYRVRELRAMPSRLEARQRGSWTAFVNREEEMALLGRRWERARAGHGNVVLLSGEPGIGKSRLAHELTNLAAGEAHYRLQFQCSAHNVGSALYPISAHLENAARIQSADSAETRLARLRELLSDAPDDLEYNLPIFARLLGLPVDAASDPLAGLSAPRAREATMEALIRRICRLAERRPLMLLFEDVHWIDPTSHELLDMFVERITDKRVLLVATFRHEYTPPWLGLPHVTRIEVNRLEPREASAIVAGLISGKGGLDAAIETIVEKTDGVPLFIEELTKAALESASAGAGAHGPRKGGDATLGLPATLKDSLMARLDRLPLAEKVMPVGAAIGRSFSYRVLAAVTGLDQAVLASALQQLVEAELLFQRGEPPDAVYTFKHALVQDVAYESLLRSRMRELHARIAAVVEESFPQIAENRPELVAHHYTRAALPRHALPYWERAADRAIARSANLEAISHLHEALRQNDEAADPATRASSEIRLREKLREPLELCGWGSEEIELNLRRLYELREQQGDRDELFSVIHGSCGTHLLAARLSEAEAEAERMAALAAETGEPAHEILTIHARAFVAFLAGRLAEAIEAFEREIGALRPEPVAAIRRHYIADPRIVARVMQAWALALSGEAERAEARIRQAEGLIEAQEQIFSRVYGLTIIASIRQTRGEAAAARELATAAWQLAQEERVPYWEAWAAVVRGWAMVATGEVETGLAMLREGLDAYARTGARQMLPYGRTLLADACLRAGHIREALSVIELIEQEDALSEVRFFDAERRKVAAALQGAGEGAGEGDGQG